MLFYFEKRQLAFDTKTWTSAELYGNGGLRLRMIHDLWKNHLHIGMGEQEIMELLGPDSADTGYFKDWSLRYWLGPEGGFINIDSRWLVLRIDGGKLREFKLVTD